jgi:alpha-tubulin suppressor-like RCC1 family protein
MVNQVELEDKSYDRENFEIIPLQNFGGYMITLVSAGEDHAAVINMNGELWIWGANHHG